MSAAASEPQELLRKFIIAGQGQPARLHIEKVPSVLKSKRPLGPAPTFIGVKIALANVCTALLEHDAP
jgi:hypothetical protein